MKLFVLCNRFRSSQIALRSSPIHPFQFRTRKMPSLVFSPAAVSIPRFPVLTSTLSSTRFLSGAHQLSVLQPLRGRRELVIRMGGGPRTYPGGVSKWQWKRMQANKAKQLLKARLCRERQLYEMRKRAELRAAASELERPWEVVERAPNLFSVSADDQLRALADRFQRPGSFDMWNDRDGPQVFRSPVDGLPSARFFPEGAVHSVKPYGVPAGPSEDGETDDWIPSGGSGRSRRRSRRSLDSHEDESTDVAVKNLNDETHKNMTFTSKNSRPLTNFNTPDKIARKDWKISLREGGARDSRKKMAASDTKQRFGWKEFDETNDNLKNLKLETGEANSVRKKMSSRNHGNSRSQGFRTRHSSNVVENTAFQRLKMDRMGSYSKHSNTRFKVGRRTLRPTTELFDGESSDRRENSMRGGDDGFRRNLDI
ncbi:hypothetical protein ZIOFF_024891 [Zingiber officinale]|uniref:DEAD-box ATP-dependent RNA helicase 33 n=2 Tax=Zingiber officinale TaxID=94328 RepID=A0A8J5GZY4_ZINOF|nr:hypothetical protein ZIOFF_024891 [Zingiber officinale]